MASKNIHLVERIRDEAGTKSKSIAKLEREAGLGNGTIRKWNDNIPSVEKLARIASILDKSMDYLYYGRENYSGLSAEEAELVDCYRKIEAVKKGYLRGYLQGFFDAIQGVQEKAGEL